MPVNSRAFEGDVNSSSYGPGTGSWSVPNDTAGLNRRQGMVDGPAAAGNRTSSSRAVRCITFTPPPLQNATGNAPRIKRGAVHGAGSTCILLIKDSYAAGSLGRTFLPLHIRVLPARELYVESLAAAMITRMGRLPDASIPSPATPATGLLIRFLTRSRTLAAAPGGPCAADPRRA